MEEPSGPVLQKVYVAMRQQQEMILELMHGFQTVREVLSETAPAFAKKFATRLVTCIRHTPSLS